jgi:hypothetical protein
MPNSQPIVIRRREVADDELRQMLITAAAVGDSANFFGRFEYFFSDNPFVTLLRAEALLSRCRKLAPDAYAKLGKGTPFYWLAWGALEVHDYETATFYIDAAVSEDLKSADDGRVNRNTVTTPSLLFFLIDDSNSAQTLLPYVRLLREKLDCAINDYKTRPDGDPNELTFIDVQNSLLRVAILKGNEHLRTLVTTFISFLLEWDHRSELIALRTEQGTAEPFFIHLFKGCVLFESLLKANLKRRPTNNTLGPILDELQSALGFAAKPRCKTGGFDFQTIIRDLSSDDNSVYTAVERTARIRNTTGHNLGWQVSLTADQYNSLAAYVASSCLHAVARLYR